MKRHVCGAFSKLIHYLWTLFLNGLLTILPITLTIAVINISFKLLKSWLAPISHLVPGFLSRIPHAEIIIAIAIIFAIGSILKLFILKRIVHILESLLVRLPLVRTLYGGIKQLVYAFNPHDMVTFRQVVLIEFPRNGLYSLGFLTKELAPELAPNKVDKFYNIFVPTTPNPTSGYFIIVAEQNITLVDLTRQEAMALIISGGIIQPERFEKE